MPHPRSAGRSQEETPDTWAGHPLQELVQNAGGGIYYAVIGSKPLEVGGKANDVWVWHWHTPADGDARWALSACGLHTVQQVEPLTLSPSLACANGCPSHGFLENGTWRSV